MVEPEKVPMEPASWESRAYVSAVPPFSKCGPWACFTWLLVGNPESQPPFPADSESAF